MGAVFQPCLPKSGAMSEIRLKETIPTLRIFDEAKAREFYVGYLGCRVDFEHRFHDNAPLYMQVSRDGMVLRLSEHHGDGNPGMHVMVNVTGIEALHAELREKRYKYMNPGLETTEWGTRQVCVYDPFGNRLYFTEPIERPT